MIHENIRKQIVELREQKGMTQQAIAEKIGMSVRTYKRLESGHKKVIDPDVLERIAEELGESLDFFFAPKHGGSAENRSLNFLSMIEEIRNHCVNLVQHYRNALEEERKRCAEKDQIISDYRTKVDELQSAPK